MSEFSDIVGILLMRNNCVVIPNFGGFVASVVSARVDVSKGIITPPRKALSFNKNLNNNDGLLTSTLAQENNVSFDKASDIITEKVQEIKHSLNKGERVHFQNVGFLYLNKAGTISFEQDRFFNLLLSSYGLSNVQFIAKELEVEEKNINTKQTKVLPIYSNENQEPKITAESNSHEEPRSISEFKPHSTVLKTIVKYASAAAIIPIAFYSFWIPMKTDVLQSGVIFSQDFNPFNKSIEAQYKKETKQIDLEVESSEKAESIKEITAQLPKKTTVFSYALDDDLFIPVKIKGKADLNKTKSADSPNLTIKKYQLIVGCFSQKDNATSLVEDLKNQGFNSFIVDFHQGLHRVSAAQASKKSELKNAREKLASSDLRSWVLKK